MNVDEIHPRVARDQDPQGLPHVSQGGPIQVIESKPDVIRVPLPLSE